jgi:hypothetical protein
VNWDVIFADGWRLLFSFAILAVLPMVWYWLLRNFGSI